MQACPRGVGEHVEHVEFGARGVHLDAVGLPLSPALLPFGFDLLEIVFHISFRFIVDFPAKLRKTFRILRFSGAYSPIKGVDCMLFRFRCLQPASRPGFCTALHGCLPPVPGRAVGGAAAPFLSSCAPSGGRALEKCGADFGGQMLFVRLPPGYRDNLLVYKK